MDQPLLDVKILELLASRICHDLISPVGAVHNGVEFLEEMGPDGVGEAVELIALSAQTAAARLQAFRLAYGAGGSDPSIKPEDVHKVFGDLTGSDGKITQEWDPHGSLGYGEDRPDAFCKMLMGVLMLAQECLPKGGTVTVSPGEGRQTLVKAAGPDPLLRDQVEKALDLSLAADNLDPRLVHPYAIGILASYYGYGLTISEKTGEHVTFALTYGSM